MRLNRNLHMHGRMRVDGHSDGAGIDTNARRQRLEMQWAKKVGDTLYEAYPGFMWAVTAHIDAKTAGVAISIPVLMGPATKYAIPLVNLVGGPSEFKKRVLEAGGHILERFNIPRSGINVAAFLHARQHHAIIGQHDRMPE